MLNKLDPTSTKSWASLADKYRQTKDKHLKTFFSEHTNRAEEFSLDFNELFLDYSKNRLDKETMALLLDLARECGLQESIDKMFEGEAINETENRAVLHTALRNRSNRPIMVDGTDVMPRVNAVLQRMEVFANKVLKGHHRGYTDQRITDIVNIGIGGSDLGPYMVTEALTPFHDPHVKAHFVSNIDGSHIHEVLRKCDPQTTLFVIASKTFTTIETMTNAHTARDWFVSNSEGKGDVTKHFVALSTNTDKVTEFGILAENTFEFWDWVGGRYSLSSAIGLSIMLSIGPKNFYDLLEGLHEMDEHFRSTPYEQNIPVILAMIGIWYRNFFDCESEAIIPYEQYLHRFPSYFQQGNMESNGKSVNRSGQSINYHTGPIIWGEPGTNGQHAFFQLLHQGTVLIPTDFIAFAQPHHPYLHHHDILLANFIAQTEALMNGKTRAQVDEELRALDATEDQKQFLAPFKVFEGNRPTNTLLLKQLTPKSLGWLIAMYEHKIFVQGIVWNIFSFDQWGVELGKQLAKGIQKDIADHEHIQSHDSSTNQIINKYKNWK